VTWGEQTFNEMAIAFLNLAPAKDSDLPELLTQRVPRLFPGIVPPAYQEMLAAARAKRPPGEGDPARRAADAMRKADTDGDGKLSVDEIAASLGGKVPAEQIEKIVAQFDRDGDKQLNLAEAAEVLQHFGSR
jgi:hypothetical protein